MKRKGFTLIELLVVISIIGLLMAIMMPALGKARKMAQAVVCGTNLKQWGTIWSCYNADYDGSYSTGIPRKPDGTMDTTKSVRGEWAQAIIPYMNEKLDIFTCPSTKDPPNGDQYGTAKYTHKVKAYDLNSDIRVDRTSYGANLWMYNISPDFPKDEIQKRPLSWHWRTAYKVKNAANAPLMLDAIYVGGGPMREGGQNRDKNLPPKYEPAYSNDFLQNWNPGCEMANFTVNRHNKAVSAVFMDGSARKVKLKELWELKWHRNYNTNGKLPDWDTAAPWMASF